ncbi:hypothetical protein L596_000260 [Steinernema carpocapsae]|uniref:SRCR domain-containing protein n=1 Tax=Steinernema carpocapsae TaxID=34508 RepID=A0A4V6I6X1_STECR|nr:hypothetical protein L596_000260 [Steinernema carpocapsae]
MMTAAFVLTFLLLICFCCASPLEDVSVLGSRQTVEREPNMSPFLEAWRCSGLNGLFMDCADDNTLQI